MDGRDKRLCDDDDDECARVTLRLSLVSFSATGIRVEMRLRYPGAAKRSAFAAAVRLRCSQKLFSHGGGAYVGV